MRELRFRAWNVKRWLREEEYFVSQRGDIFFTDDECEVYRDDSVDVVLMQYTGLKDKNGKEIYEGDIVEFSVFDYNGSDTQYKGVVVFACGEWQIWGSLNNPCCDPDGPFDLHWVVEQDDSIEIIGNVHQHPELLEVTP